MERGESAKRKDEMKEETSRMPLTPGLKFAVIIARLDHKTRGPLP